jgi:hypothetical protein
VLIHEVQIPGLLLHPHFRYLLGHLSSPPFPACGLALDNS